MHFLHIAFLGQLALREDVADMARDDRLVAAEQLPDLRLRHPERFALIADVDPQSLLAAVDEEEIAGLGLLFQANRFILVGHARL